MTVRAAVLARGLGTRMRSADDSAALTAAQRRAADAGMKAMMPVAGRPFLDFVLSALADAGIRHAALVVAPDHAAVREHYDRMPPQRLSIEYLVQAEPRGTADAVLAIEAWTGDDPFLVVNGDNLYPVQALRELAALAEPGLAGFDADDLVRSSNIEPARLRAFATADTDGGSYLARIVEKPSDADAPAPDRPRLISMNCWRFDARIFDACRDVAPSPRGELELPSAVTLALARGVPFRVVPARGPVLDLSQRADAAEVARRLAATMPRL